MCRACRSRGGFGSKFHLVTDGKGTPLAIEVTAGQVHESTRFESLVATFVASRKRRRRRKPRKLAGDKGYSVARIRDWLKARGIAVVLAGARAPGRALGAYGREFDQVFAAVAQANRVALAPDLLAGVIDRPAMKQADGLHPNAAGARLIASRLAPVVAKALAARRRR